MKEKQLKRGTGGLAMTVMTVGELIKELEKFDKDKEVFVMNYDEWTSVFEVAEDDDGVYLGW